MFGLAALTMLALPLYLGLAGANGRRAVHRALRTGRAMREALGRLDGKLS